MFTQHSSEGYKSPIDKIHMKTLAFGEKSLMTEFRMKEGACLPLHSHEHEQTGYLISGELTLYIGADVFNVNPGDSWSIPGGIEHRAIIHKDSVAIEVFSPVREDYLP